MAHKINLVGSKVIDGANCVPAIGDVHITMSEAAQVQLYNIWAEEKGKERIDLRKLAE
jgi:hypothetical protein